MIISLKKKGVSCTVQLQSLKTIRNCNTVPFFYSLLDISHLFNHSCLTKTKHSQASYQKEHECRYLSDV